MAKKRVGKRNFRTKRVTPTAGDFSRPLVFTQAGMDSKNSFQEKAITQGMEKLLGPVPKGKSLGT